MEFIIALVAFASGLIVEATTGLVKKASDKAMGREKPQGGGGPGEELPK
jgi:hypothetical protein